MENLSRTRNSKKRPLDDQAEHQDVPENGNGKPLAGKTRSSSRRRRGSPSTTDSVISTTGSAKLENTFSSNPTTGFYESTGASSPEAVESGGPPHDSDGNKKHFTRSRKPNSSSGPPSLTDKFAKEEKSTGERKSISVDACASILATVDELSYQAALLKDAQSISQVILQPMALPWMHEGLPVARNIACDLDDLTEILTADDGLYTPFENGPFGFGKFDVGQLRRGPSNARLATSPDFLCLATRRSYDPGVIEMASVILPPYPPNSETSPPLLDSGGEISSQESADVPDIGDVSLRCFQEALKMRKRRIEQAKACTRSEFISVNVNSSSSRSTILPSNLDANAPLGSTSTSPQYLQASLPQDVQNGRFLSINKAKSIAETLGTYDLRHGLNPTNLSGKNSNRTSVGRTRLMWTEKSPADQPQRVFFTSLLTGERLESGTQKRPRQVKLAIKVGGEYFVRESRSQSAGRSVGRILALPSFYGGNKNDRHLPGESIDAVNASAQCALNPEQLVQNLLKGQPTELLDACTQGNNAEAAFVKHPVLASLPDNTGIIATKCISPGKTSFLSIHDMLNTAARNHNKCCSVCWSKRSDGDVEECCHCGLLVHPGCCLNPGRKLTVSNVDAQTKWKCGSCFEQSSCNTPPRPDNNNSISKASRKPKRKPRPASWLADFHTEQKFSKEPSALAEPSRRKCVFCPFYGGAMSLVPLDGGRAWTHEICRTWIGPQSGLRARCPNESCALCGNKECVEEPTESSVQTREVVMKCAAAKCQVYMHPMCAVLSSKIKGYPKIRDKTNGSTKSEEQIEADDLKSRDFERCCEFTVASLICNATSGSLGKRPSKSSSTVLPVVFCGIHNPGRESSFLGLNAGGMHVDEKVMGVPSRRSRSSN